MVYETRFKYLKSIDDVRKKRKSLKSKFKEPMVEGAIVLPRQVALPNLELAYVKSIAELTNMKVVVLEYLSDRISAAIIQSNLYKRMIAYPRMFSSSGVLKQKTEMAAAIEENPDAEFRFFEFLTEIRKNFDVSELGIETMSVEELQGCKECFSGPAELYAFVFRYYSENPIIPAVTPFEADDKKILISALMANRLIEGRVAFLPIPILKSRKTIDLSSRIIGLHNDSIIDELSTSTENLKSKLGIRGDLNNLIVTPEYFLELVNHLKNEFDPLSGSLFEVYAKILAEIDRINKDNKDYRSKERRETGLDKKPKRVIV